MAPEPLFKRERRRHQLKPKHRRWTRYLRVSGRKSSKSGMFRTGKMLPAIICHGRVTSGTRGSLSPFHHQHETGGGVMYIGLGGLLILILILWLLGVI
jgi:hypothetical protein